MKKLIILLVIVTVFTSMPIIAKDNESAEDFIFKINEKMDDFSNWNNLSDFKKYTLYDNKLNVSGYLFSHKNDKGYFILNVDDELSISTGISMMSSSPDVYLSDVEDFTWYKGCAPTAAANLVYFWADNGYSRLTWGLNSSQIISKLAELIRTSSSGSTTVSDISPGLIDYMEYKGYNNFTESLVTYPSYSQCKTEINNDRPALVSLINNDDYGNHTVTLAGYNDSVVDELLIIHDTWSSTATKVYIAHDTSVKYLHRIYD